MDPRVRDMIVRMSVQRRLDPRATTTVSLGEGGLEFGAEGDGGHAHGPFQLNDAGGVLTNRPGDHKAFANSKAGIAFALDGMVAAGAAGKKGLAAVKHIIYNYERPADKAGSFERAKGNWAKVVKGEYGKFGGAASGADLNAGALVANTSRAMQSTGAATARRAVLGALMERNAAFAAGRPNEAPSAMQLLLTQSVGRREEAAAVTRERQATAPLEFGTTGGAQVSTKPGTYKGSLQELFHDPLGGYDRAGGKLTSIGAIGGHDKHVHSAYSTPKAALAAIKLAQSMGLHVSENPYVDKVDPVHTEGSWHYKTFKGTYNGRKLGQGMDVSGDPRKMAEYFRTVKRQYG